MTAQIELWKDEHYVHHNLRCFTEKGREEGIRKIFHEFPPLIWGTYVNNHEYKTEKEETYSIGFGDDGKNFIKHTREFDVYYVKVLRFKTKELCRIH